MTWDIRMIGIPNQPERGAVVIDLPDRWAALDVAPRRLADVGKPVLTYVTVVSAAEAAKINARYRAQAQARLDERLATEGEDYIGMNIDRNAVSAANRVDALLEAITQEGYFSSWVLIEECTID
jgi:hypothetical protein